MYVASLKTEEMQPVSFDVIFLDPRNPDPEPPHVIRPNRWQFVPLEQPIHATVANLCKFARASDPRTSSLVMYPDSHGELRIWGFVDQGSSHHHFVTHESEEGFERPGLFQVSIAGIGHLVVFKGFETIGELKRGALGLRSPDILHAGPVSKLLYAGFEKPIRLAISRIPKEVTVFPEQQKQRILLETYITTITRLMLRIQSLGQGAGLLVSPTGSHRKLDVKYPLRYRGLMDTATRYINHKFALASLLNLADRSKRNEKSTMGLQRSHQNIWGGLSRLQDLRGALDGVLWFVSLLARVDGLVLMTPDMQVRGFGVEITERREPQNVYLSRTAQVRHGLSSVDYDLYGTRHRSMMRYCAAVPGSIGWVFSHDGDIRVMTRVGTRLVLWENIRLRLDLVRRWRHFERRGE